MFAVNRAVRAAIVDHVRGAVATSTEQQFLTALNAVSRYETNAAALLLTFDDTGTQRLELIEIDPTIEEVGATVSAPSRYVSSDMRRSGDFWMG
jgi:hypothetical protein